MDRCTVPQARSLRFLFKRQGYGLVGLIVLGSVCWKLAEPSFEDGGELLVSTRTWMILAMAVPVVHQLMVWLVWRGQLGWRALTRLFGDRDLDVWKAMFIPMLLARPVTAALLGMSDAGSLGLSSLTCMTIGALLLVPAGYAAYSATRYFGTERVIGGDHFRLSYRRMPMVTSGLYAWLPNALYTVGFLLLWGIAFLTGSKLALILALFQHGYIWVHYYCTEVPNMQLMYERLPEPSIVGLPIPLSLRDHSRPITLG